jgi:hypothetical protein
VDASAIQPSHNPFSFEPNPAYPHVNERDGEMKRTLREERFHAQQQWFVGLDPRRGQLRSKDHVDTTALFALPSAQIARENLLDIGYPDHPDILAAEIGAKIAAGSWDELGLTVEQARDLFYEYGRLLVDRHGPGVVFKFRGISPILREAFYDAGREAGKSQSGAPALGTGRAQGQSPAAPGRAGPSANATDRGGGQGQGGIQSRVAGDLPREVPVTGDGEVLAQRRRSPEEAGLERNPERGSIDPDLLTLGIRKFAQDDVIPTIQRVAGDVSEARDAVFRLVAPTMLSRQAEMMGLALRHRMAQFARRSD